MLKTRQEIYDWLDEMGVSYYSLQADLTVKVEGTVNLYGKKLKEIPVQFGTTGHFSIENNNLTSLKGCPHTVNGIFNCSKNLLTSLEYGPKVVTHDYYCHENNLTNLLGCPIKLERAFGCSSNNLTSLEHLPNEIKGNLYLGFNKLSSFEHLPTQIGGFVQLEFNPITSIEHLHSNINGGIKHATYPEQLIPLLESFYTLDDTFNIYKLDMSPKKLETILLYRDLYYNTNVKNTSTKKIKI